MAVGLFEVDGGGTSDNDEEESSTFLQTFDEENYYNVQNAEDALNRYNDLKICKAQ